MPSSAPSASTAPSAAGGAVPGHVAWVVGRTDGGTTSAGHDERWLPALLALVEAALDLGIAWLTVADPSRGQPLRERAAALARRGVAVALHSAGPPGDGTAPGALVPRALVPLDSPRLQVLCAQEGSGRRELVGAVRELAARGVRPEDVRGAAVSGALGVPDVDLLVLTEGRRRVPDLLVWQVAYSEIVVLDDAWPAVGAAQFHAAIAEYRRRDRRYGGLVASR